MSGWSLAGRPVLILLVLSAHGTANSALLGYTQLAEEQWLWFCVCLYIVSSVGKTNSFLSKRSRDGAVFCGLLVLYAVMGLHAGCACKRRQICRKKSFEQIFLLNI